MNIMIFILLVSLSLSLPLSHRLVPSPSSTWSPWSSSPGLIVVSRSPASPSSTVILDGRGLKHIRPALDSGPLQMGRPSLYPFYPGHWPTLEKPLRAFVPNILSSHRLGTIAQCCAFKRFKVSRGLDVVNGLLWRTLISLLHRFIRFFSNNSPFHPYSLSWFNQSVVADEMMWSLIQKIALHRKVEIKNKFACFCESFQFLEIMESKLSSDLYLGCVVLNGLN